MFHVEDPSRIDDRPRVAVDAIKDKPIGYCYFRIMESTTAGMTPVG